MSEWDNKFSVSLSAEEFKKGIERAKVRLEALTDQRSDWSDTLRPGVLGGECARCFHQPPLHEPGCVMLACVRPNPCACHDCTISPELPMREPLPPRIPDLCPDDTYSTHGPSCGCDDCEEERSR
jgi:hypothetical protein